MEDNLQSLLSASGFVLLLASLAATQSDVAGSCLDLTDASVSACV